MKQPAPSSRDLLARMLAKVDEMQRALLDAEQGVAAQGGERLDVTRATSALHDLERRVRGMLEDEA